MQIVRIQALPREGFSFRPRAGRFFPSGEAVTLEVVDQETDPTVKVQKADSAGKTYEVDAPDPKRISKAVFESMILTDPVLKVLADGETISVLSQAALDAARKQASELAGKLTDAEVAKAQMGEQLQAYMAESRRQVDELAKAHERIAELEAKLASSEGTTPPATPPGDPHEKGRGRK